MRDYFIIKKQKYSMKVTNDLIMIPIDQLIKILNDDDDLCETEEILKLFMEANTNIK